VAAERGSGFGLAAAAGFVLAGAIAAVGGAASTRRARREKSVEVGV
jgi:hypothetical protein